MVEQEAAARAALEAQVRQKLCLCSCSEDLCSTAQQLCHATLNMRTLLTSQPHTCQPLLCVCMVHSSYIQAASDNTALRALKAAKQAAQSAAELAAKQAELRAAAADPWLNEDPQQAASTLSPVRVRTLGCFHTTLTCADSTECWQFATHLSACMLPAHSHTLTPPAHAVPAACPHL